jgi:hypothetical protein|tara:strand:+ start:427 stop:825 length:399 start_codon:yes stop_codon:yes gene_type:complete
MATVRITLPLPVNTSLQPKVSTVASDTSSTADSGGWDIIYFVKMVDGKQSGEVIELGECIAVVQGATTYTVDVETDGNEILPTANDYIFFGKNNKISTSSLSGYYAEVQMNNDSTASAELFAVSAEVVKSSK